MSERLTRKDMKRDEVQEWMVLAYHWILDHSRALLLSLVGILGLGLLGVLVFVYLQHRETVSQEALAEALRIYEAPINASSSNPDDPDSPSFPDEAARRARARELFLEVRNDYGSTGAGDVALAYLGRIAAAEGKTDEARELWTEFLAAAPESAIAASIQLALYSMQRGEGSYEELVAELEQALESESSPLPTDALLFELALTQELQGEVEESERNFQRLVDEFPSSPYAVEARQRLTGLGGRLQLGT